MIENKKYKPVIDSEFWQVAGVPDLGEKYNTDERQPVDFGIWQAADGTWQIWSCIRFCNCGERRRLLYGWEAQNITDSDWKPLGIRMEADVTLGETSGGLQAPFVTKKEGLYYMLYGDWNRICIATSEDGKNFERFMYDKEKGHVLFQGPYTNTRDCCVIQVDGLYYCYYTGHVKNQWPQSAVFLRTSKDLLNWSQPTAVNYGGIAATKADWFGGDSECPYVVPFKGQYILFRNQIYVSANLNHQYCSHNPVDFGCDNDNYLTGSMEITAPEIVFYNNEYYMASLMPKLNGIRICKIKFEEI